MVNLLTLAPDSAPKFHAWYWEPLVDGLPLRRLILLDPDEVALDTADRGPAGDRIPVFAHYVCPICADLGCGVVSAVVERTSDSVTGRDFGWDVDYETGEDVVRFAGGPFVFDRQQHDAEIERFVDTCDAVRVSVPPRPVPGSRNDAARGRLLSLFRAPRRDPGGG